jgi:hypothetical protein
MKPEIELVCKRCGLIIIDKEYLRQHIHEHTNGMDICQLTKEFYYFLD